MWGLLTWAASVSSSVGRGWYGLPHQVVERVKHHGSGPSHRGGDRHVVDLKTERTSPPPVTC